MQCQKSDDSSKTDNSSSDDDSSKMTEPENSTSDRSMKKRKKSNFNVKTNSTTDSSNSEENSTTDNETDSSSDEMNNDQPRKKCKKPNSNIKPNSKTKSVSGIKRKKIAESSNTDKSESDQPVKKLKKSNFNTKTDSSSDETDSVHESYMVDYDSALTVKKNKFDLAKQELSDSITIPAAVPDYFSNNNYLISSFRYLEKYPNLSFFCCLAYEKAKKKGEMKKSIQLFRCAYPDTNLKMFKGVDPFDIKEMNRLCRLLQKYIFIYAPKKSGNGKIYTVYQSFTENLELGRGCEIIELLVYNGRYSYIKDLNRLRGEYHCNICKTYYYDVSHLNRHKKESHGSDAKQNIPKQKMGSYKAKLYFKQKLQNQGVPEKLLTNVNFKHFMCYDIEACLLDKNANPYITYGKMSLRKDFTQKHRTICIALSTTFSRTNIFNLHRYDDTGPVDIIHRFVKRALQLAGEVEQIYLRENRELIKFLEKIKRKAIKRRRTGEYRRIEKLIKQIYSYARSVPLIGFNSARYDTQVMRYDGLFIVLQQLDPPVKIIKKGGFIKISTPHLIWLDAIKYTGGGYSLRRFIKSFAPEIKETKSYFPYEALNKFKKLKNKFFPEYNMFESKLVGCNVLEEEYAKYSELLEQGFTTDEACKELKIEIPPLTGKQNYDNLKKVWDEKKIKNWQDFLNYYVHLDVKPFKKALQNLLNYFHEKDVDLFKAHCSLPATAENMLFQSVECDQPSFLYLDAENYDLIRRTVHGGLVLNSQRLFDCAAGMKIKEYKYGDLALPGKIIISYDVNNLYGGIMGLISHLTGPYVQRDLADGYSLKWCYENIPNVTKNPGCYTWLASVGLKYMATYDQPLNIKSAYNTGEKWIYTDSGNRYRVDGYVPKQPHNGQSLVLEYYGCLHHAHPEGKCLNKGYLPTDEHPLKTDKNGKKMTNDQVYQETMTRLEDIQDSGFETQIIWECEWHKKMKKLPKAKDLIQDHLIPGLSETIKISTENEMLDAILKEKVYGIVFSSASVPDDLKDTVFEYPPFFKKVENFSLNKIPDTSFMKQYCLKHGLVPGKSFLTSLVVGDDLIIPSEMVRFCLLQNYKVFNVWRVLQFGNSKSQPFKKFVDGMIIERREGAVQGNMVKANMAKLILNSAVGFTLMQTNLLPNTTICDSKKTKKMSRVNPRVINCESLGPSDAVKEFYTGKKVPKLFLITAEKRNPPLISNMPVLLGWKVLAMAKLQMLQLFASLRYYFDDTKWQFIYSDTDSLVCALAENNIDLCVKQCHKNEWEQKKRDIFVTNETGICDNYTPLRLKIEAIGDKFACLSAKMYCIAGVNEEIIKSAQKGVKLALNRNLVGYAQYKRMILEKGEPPLSSKYVGFLGSYKDDGFYTVESEKKSFTGLYFKREVLANGYWTQPLDWDKKLDD